MIRTILVPSGGSSTDHAVFETARAVGSPFAAHLSFLHVRIGAGEAALNTPHADFARGLAMSNELAVMEHEAKTRSAAAARHVRDFCDQWRIPFSEEPGAADRMSASFREETGHAAQRLLAHARLNDLVVLGRFTHPNGLPVDLPEQLLRGCGRPLLIAASSPATTLLRTVMVCWKDAAGPAHALAAAMPYLRKAERVIVVTVDEGEPRASTPDDVAAYLAWHGIRADPRSIAANGHSTATVLLSAADACGADLIVMGSFGHGRARTIIFGSCTQTVLSKAALPIFLLH